MLYTQCQMPVGEGTIIQFVLRWLWAEAITYYFRIAWKSLECIAHLK